VVPKDVNIIYFYNPFKGQVLKNVINNIYNSYKQYPRIIYIIFFNNNHFENVIANQDWVMQIYQKTFYSMYSCGIYVTKAPQDCMNGNN
jgi:hypothetical protein